METDHRGNTFIIGGFNGTVVLPGTGTTSARTLTSFGQTDIFLTKMDCNRNMVWKNSIGSSGHECGDYYFLGLKYDNKSNIYISGTFSGTATFTTTSGSSQTITSNGSYDIFFAKYDTLGVLQWVLKSGGVDADEGCTVGIDNNGNIFIGGYFRSTAVFSTNVGSTQSVLSSGAQDIFVAKYLPTGALQWVRTAGGFGIDLASSIAFDNQNNLYVAGNFGHTGNSCTFGSNTIANSSNWGGYVAKLSSNGVWVWVNGMSGSADEGISSCIVDENCNVYTAGHFGLGNTSFSSLFPGSSVSLISNGDYDLCVSSYDSSGVIRWAKNMGSSSTEYGLDIVINKANNLAVSGTFSSTANFGNSVSLTSNGAKDGYVCQLNPANGNAISAVKVGGSGDDYCYKTIPDYVGNMFSCGFFTNTATFGSTNLVTNGNEDAFFMKFAPTTIIPLKPINLNLCSGDSAILIPKDSLTGLSFQWYRNNTIIAGANRLSYAAKLAGTYFLKVANSCNEQDSSETINLNFFANTVNAGNDLTICLGDSVQLNANGLGSVVWSPPNGLSNLYIVNPWAKPSDTTKYVIKAVNGACSAFDTIIINVNKIGVNAGIDKGVCPGDSVQLLGFGNGNLFWNASPFLSNSLVLNPYAKPPNTTFFILNVFNGICSNSDTVEVAVSLPLLLNGGINRSICLGDTVHLQASGGFNYNWNYNLTLSDSSIYNPVAKPNSTTNYIVKSGLNNCPSFDTVNIEVKPLPLVSAGNDTIICKGFPYQLTGQVQFADIYNWSPVYYLNNGSLLNPTIQSPKTEKYLLVVENTTTTCKASDSVFVQVDSVIALFNTNVTMGIVPLSVLFTNNSVNANTFLWIFENGKNSIQKSPTYTFNDIGEYNVILLAKNNNGCQDTARVSIYAEDEIKFQIPNAFTPNGDNLNDYFENKISNYKMLKYLKGTIWNRWGQLIYEYNMPNGKWWDGQYNNNPSQEGIYVYIVEAESIEGKKYSFHGTVTLLR
jgi:gliding motility-associated-like protein